MAIEIISRFDVRQLVILSVMKISGKSGNGFVMPKAESVAEVIAQARRVMPKVSISLGCARQRGNRKLETLAIDAGVNRMALPSEEAVERARSYGLEVKFQATCCSVSEDLSVDMPLTNGKGSRPAPEHIRSHSRAGGNPGGARGREPTLPRKLRGAPATRQSPGYRCGIMK